MKALSYCGREETAATKYSWRSEVAQHSRSEAPRGPGVSPSSAARGIVKGRKVFFLILEVAFVS